MSLPPLAAEDHCCARCGLDYAEVAVADALAAIEAVPTAAAAAVRAVEPARRGQRPDATTWSVNEYVCHLRDVYVSSTIRLHRIRTEDDPMLEPMFNELRARRFGYRDADAEAVLVELRAAVTGLLDESAAVADADWSRVGTRLPGEVRTALWTLRQAMHEGVHHVQDLYDVSTAVTALGERPA